MKDSFDDIINSPMLMIGDFNALSKADYSEQDWTSIENVRKAENWELPQTELLDLIMNDEIFKFEDVFSMAKDESKGILNNVDFTNLKSFGTCRFDTRIDYILGNHVALQLFNIVAYEQFSVNNSSDHKLVRATLQICQV